MTDGVGNGEREIKLAKLMTPALLRLEGIFF